MLPGSALAETITVSGGPAIDYQPSIVKPWARSDERIVVFERLAAGTFSGDLLVTFSSDAGLTWSEASVVIDTAANERHPALVQTAAAQFQLYYLSDATGSFRIHRSSSADARSFAHHGALDLGWPTGGEINPHVIRHGDGSLSMTYHRLGGASYIARSFDHGLSWDSDRVQVSPGNAALPRLAYRQSDGLYLLVYQTNPGNNQLRLWARTSTDPTQWDTEPTEIAAGGNNHDAFPMFLDDGRMVVFWSRVADGNFQLFSSQSADGQTWSMPRPQISRPGLANVQPHGLLLEGSVVDLYWGAAQNAQGSNYDILRQLLFLDHLFVDRFEDPEPAIQSRRP